MKLLYCPMNGWRPEDEFVCGGAIKPQPTAAADDATWCDYLLMQDNTAGPTWEWWCHVPSGFWFAACRNTISDEVLEVRSVTEIEKGIADGTIDLSKPPTQVADNLQSPRLLNSKSINIFADSNSATVDSATNTSQHAVADSLLFDFNGTKIMARPHDSVAVALWRAGITTLSRSFKYHRRRGILSLAMDDIAMDVDDFVNAPATTTKVREGMIVRARHFMGSLEKDWLVGMSLLSRFLPPGFYYKAFYKPHGVWPKWEKLIRRLAGLGEVNQATRLSPLLQQHAFCDVAVIGGGAAGLAAAQAAAKQGKQVWILDKNREIGGAYLWRVPNRMANRTSHSTNDEQYIAQMESLRESVCADDNIRIVRECVVTGVFDDVVVARVACANGDESLRLRANKIIYATGARDTPVVFVNNDLPGVMLLSAAQRLAFVYDVLCGQRAVVLACCAADAEAVRHLQNYGVNIVAVLNIGAVDAEWAKALAADGFAVFANINSVAAQGQQHVKAINFLADNKTQHLSCDCILMNGGFIPTSELPAAAGVHFPYDAQLRRPQADDSCLAGAVHGRFSLAAAMDDGIASVQNFPRPLADAEPAAEHVFLSGGHHHNNKQNNKGKAFIDFDEDLQLSDLDFAIAEGFDDIQLLKRYTTAGMGLSQGKLTNVLVMRYLSQKRGGEDVGQVTARPPAMGETFCALASGEHPIKRTALHARHEHLVASFMPAAAWLRPAYYGSIESEVQSVRTQAGMIDISTLGKILVAGADAASFLERFYTGRFAKQKVGSARYAILLDEMGVIVDDGIVARLDEMRFWVTATTGNADAIYRQMLLWRTRWNMQVDIINMTQAMSAMNLAGPQAPELMANIVGAAEADMEYMQAKEIQVGGATWLLMRVGFVGEKGYEIHLPAGYAVSLWDKLLSHARPFGVQAQRLLRLEKGHIIIGQDTDGLTTPLEADMEWALPKGKEEYLGKRAVDIHRQRGLSRQLRGFVMDGKWRQRITESDLILSEQGDAVGRVTSVEYSPSLDCLIGLAYASPQTAKDGDILRLRTADGVVMQARTTPPPFYDPSGARQK